MTRTISRTTLNREAYHALRSAILGRKLAPGTKLVVRVLAEQLRLSATPVKEALSALEREGLVVGVAHRGYFVLEPSLEDVREIYPLREVLEGLAARISTENQDRELAGQLGAILSQQRQAAQVGQMESYGDLDLAFHRRLWEASGNKRLLRAAESIDGQIRLLINSTAAIPGRLSASLDEHQAIVEAVLQGHAAAAEEAMRGHVQRAGKALEAFLSRGL
jgi:DNA-binding GntR family transcriptional regulator